MLCYLQVVARVVLQSSILHSAQKCRWQGPAVYLLSDDDPTYTYDTLFEPIKVAHLACLFPLSRNLPLDCASLHQDVIKSREVFTSDRRRDMLHRFRTQRV